MDSCLKHYRYSIFLMTLSVFDIFYTNCKKFYKKECDTTG
ncbi:hypothetical protein HMPREF9554_00781 [Treponema phagedenis F0421]|nr:hypothetical protein HMPREF9554_00781 [Treponema phagedenis F0421]